MRVVRLLVFLFFGISSMGFARISLVWQAERKKVWEEDWLTELLTGIDYEIVDDMKFEKYIDNSIVVVVPPQEKQMVPYFKKMHDLGYKFGVILLSDECYTCTTEFYQYAQFVFRNYWHKQFAHDPKVICFGLGYKTGFWKSIPRSLAANKDRPYCWSFAGQIGGKPTRAAMISELKKAGPYCIHEINAWLDPRSLGTQEYQSLMLNSVFIPCGRGFWNIDSFRIWEALECGCIPIVEKFPLDYFKKFLGDHPFLAVDSWEQAPFLMAQLFADPGALEAKRQECMQWWREYKKKTNMIFVHTIKSKLAA